MVIVDIPTTTGSRITGGNKNEPLPTVRTSHSPDLKRVNLALQGEGHGAFTRGVLDRLLEDKRIVFEGISAASAGSINATVFTCGLAEGGRQGAKRALAKLWRRIAHLGSFTLLQPSILDRLGGNRSLDASPAFMLFDLVPDCYRPTSLTRSTIIHCAKYESTLSISRRCVPTTVRSKLFLSATNVRTGKIKVFDNDDIGPEAVLASACLPPLFQAVEIDGEHYWDGGYMGNPPIFPLIYGCHSRDVLIVHINPIERVRLPTTAGEIINRINEISFHSSLMREMRAIAFCQQADRRRQGPRQLDEANADPQYRGCRNYGRTKRGEQAQHGLGQPYRLDEGRARTC
jgi:NTE family protein